MLKRRKRREEIQRYRVMELHYKNPKWNAKQLAEAAGCRVGNIYAIFHSFGKSTPSHYRRLMDWERQAVLDAYRNGEKAEAIAAEFNTNLTTIRDIRRKAGVGPRNIGVKKTDIEHALGYMESISKDLASISANLRMALSSVRKIRSLGVKKKRRLKHG